MGLAAIGLPIAVLRPAPGAVWIATWVGTALLLIGTRRRLPRFVPRKAPAVLPNIDPSRVEGAPRPYGAWWMVLPFTLSTTVAPAALLVDDGLVVLAIPCSLLLLAFTIMAWFHDRPSAKVIARILGAPRTRRIEGTVARVEGTFARHIAWRTWSGTHHSTATVEGIHGGPVTVATVTHTSNACGTREEVRSPWVVAPDGGGAEITVGGHDLQWAAVPEPAPEGRAALRAVGTVEEYTMMLFPVVARQVESIRAGDRVVVVAAADEIADRRLRGRADAPLLAYGTSTGKPLQQLRRHALTRRAFIAGIAACLAVTVTASVQPRRFHSNATHTAAAAAQPAQKPTAVPQP